MITKADIKQETNSVSYNYEHLGVISFKYDDEEKKIIAKNKINDIVSRLDLNSDEINLNNYSWYEQGDTKKLALKR